VNTLAERMLRAARLDVNLYEEVEADTQTMGQATTVVVLASLAAGLARVATEGLAGIVIVTLGALLGWYVWAFLTYFIGTRFLPEPQTKADLGELLRTIGFASSPGLIRVGGIISPLQTVLFFAASIWMLVAMVVAVRQALDYTSTWRAIGVCAIGWLAQGVMLAILLVALGDPSLPM
jgi:Yip1-like protein